MDQLRNDGQPQSSAAELPGGTSVGLNERLKNLFLTIRWNPDSRVGHVEAQLIGSAACGSLYTKTDRYPALVCELHGIVHQVHQDLFEPHGVSQHRGRYVAFDVVG